MKRIILILLVLAGPLDMIAGGGWTQPKGRGYFKISQWWLIATQHFTDVGKIDPNVTSGLFNTSLYAEYGITNRITVIGNIPFFSRAYNNNIISGTTGELIQAGEAINSFGDVDLAVQYGIITNKSWVLSARVQFGLPLGEDFGGSQGTLQTGDGEFNQMLRVDASTSFNVAGFPAYFSTYVGVNNRSNGFSDELRFGAEAGVQFFNNKLIAITRLDAIESFRNGDSNDAPNSTSIFANNTEFLSLTPELGYQITDQIGISANVGVALRGRLIFADPTYSVGVFFKI